MRQGTEWGASLVVGVTAMIVLHLAFARPALAQPRDDGKPPASTTSAIALSSEVAGERDVAVTVYNENLGVGIGHPEATSEYRHPLTTILDYLSQLDAAGVPRENLVLAALGPKVLAAAAEYTRGAHPYLTTPRHTR